VVALILVTAGLSCGPSFRRTYQSDNAFLRCFDMDYTPGITIEAKKLCWKTWLNEHVYNQPGDKINYARLRLDEIADGVSVPGPPGPPGEFDKRPALEDAKVFSDAGLSEENLFDGGLPDAGLSDAGLLN